MKKRWSGTKENLMKGERLRDLLRVARTILSSGPLDEHARMLARMNGPDIHGAIREATVSVQVAAVQADRVWLNREYDEFAAMIAVAKVIDPHYEWDTKPITWPDGTINGWNGYGAEGETVRTQQEAVDLLTRTMEAVARTLGPARILQGPDSPLSGESSWWAWRPGRLTADEAAIDDADLIMSVRRGDAYPPDWHGGNVEDVPGWARDARVAAGMEAR